MPQLVSDCTAGAGSLSPALQRHISIHAESGPAATFQPSAEATDPSPEEGGGRDKVQDTGVLLPAPLLGASLGYQAVPSGSFITHLSLQQVKT